MEPRTRRALPAILFAAIAVVVAVIAVPQAVARPAVPIDVVADVARASVGPGYPSSYAVTCATTATPMWATSALYGANTMSTVCQAPEPAETGASTLVGIGDVNVGDPAYATRTGEVICGTGCNAFRWSGNTHQIYCRADSGTVKLTCNSLVDKPQ